MWILNINYNWMYFIFPYVRLNHFEWYAGIYRIILLIISIITMICFFVLIPNNTNKFTWIGEHTLFIYLTHGLILIMLFKIY